MNNRHPWPLKKSKSWGLFWRYQPNGTANSAHLAHFLGGQAELAVLFSMQLQNSPQDFDFFNGHGCQLINEACAPQFNGHNNSFLASLWPGLAFSFFQSLCTNKQVNINCLGLKNTFFKGELCCKKPGVHKIAIFADVQYQLGQKNSKITL